MSHIDRMRQLGNIALPNEDSPLHDIIVKKLKNMIHPIFKNELEKLLIKLLAIVDAQRKNGCKFTY